MRFRRINSLGEKKTNFSQNHNNDDISHPGARLVLTSAAAAEEEEESQSNKLNQQSQGSPPPLMRAKPYSSQGSGETYMIRCRPWIVA